jgi:hypothetical protein
MKANIIQQLKNANLNQFCFFIKQFFRRRNKPSWYFIIYGSLYSLMAKRPQPHQEELINKNDWDVLIILDACRYDYFEREYKKFFPQAELKKVYSPASGTSPWLNQVFPEKYNELQIISSSPRINTRDIDILGYNSSKHFNPQKVIELWDSEWDKSLETVKPQTVVKHALKHKDYPQKQMIWFMQPHGPWIGQKKILPVNFKIRRAELEGNEEPVVAKIRTGEISQQEFRNAYQANLELVLNQIKKMLDQWPKNKKIVITSDHGELLGEFNSYLHYTGLSCKKLREVPWLEVTT